MLIGIGGEKFAGKDTFATIFKTVAAEHNHDYTITYFAKALKEVCQDVFGVDMMFFVDPDLKEVPFPFGMPVIIDNFIQELRDRTGLSNIEPHGFIAETPRELLQYVGTEYVRAAKETYWVDQVDEEIQLYPNLLNPDCRFPNEERLILDRGGIIVVVSRIDKMREYNNTTAHASEQGLKHIDLLVGARTGDTSIHSKVAECILHYPHLTPLFDYRNLKRLREIVNTDGCISSLEGLVQSKTLAPEPVTPSLQVFATIMAVLKYYEGVEA